MSVAEVAWTIECSVDDGVAHIDLIPDTARRPRIPLWIKVGYTAFVVVLVPVYWRHYGPANFLWFSDIALLTTNVALWRESRFLASTQAVSVGLLELLWISDYVLRLITGLHVNGISAYMFDPKIPRFIRSLSFFHLPLPVLLLWMVERLGYDRRAWLAQTALAWTVLVGCYFLSDPAQNINWVFGPGERPQTRIPRGLYLALVLAFFPLAVYLPTHLALRRLPAPAAPRDANRWGAATRLVAGVAGGALAAYGVTRRSPLAALLGAVGAGLLVRTITNRPLWTATSRRNNTKPAPPCGTRPGHLRPSPGSRRAPAPSTP
jgi:hypothetical protein